jgi:hypothetical protein
MRRDFARRTPSIPWAKSLVFRQSQQMRRYFSQRGGKGRRIFCLIGATTGDARLSSLIVVTNLQFAKQMNLDERLQLLSQRPSSDLSYRVAFPPQSLADALN